MKLVSEKLVNDATKLMYTITGSYDEAEKILEVGDKLSNSPRYVNFVEYSELEDEPYYIMLVDVEAKKIFEEDYEEIMAL